GQLMAVLHRIGDARLMPFLLGATVVVAAFLVTSRTHRLPAPLIGVALAIAVGRFLGMHEKEVGLLPAGLPPLAVGWWDPKELVAAIASAFALALISSVNILITSRVVEHFRGRHRRMRPSDADKELGAYGLANLCAGMIGAPLSVGIPARSLAVVRCGGSTPV